MKAIILINVPEGYEKLDLYYKDGWIYAKGIDPDYEYKGLYELACLRKIKLLPAKLKEPDLKDFLNENRHDITSYEYYSAYTEAYNDLLDYLGETE